MVTQAAPEGTFVMIVTLDFRTGGTIDINSTNLFKDESSYRFHE